MIGSFKTLTPRRSLRRFGLRVPGGAPEPLGFGAKPLVGAKSFLVFWGDLRRLPRPERKGGKLGGSDRSLSDRVFWGDYEGKAGGELGEMRKFGRWKKKGI